MMCQSTENPLLHSISRAFHDSLCPTCLQCLSSCCPLYALQDVMSNKCCCSGPSGASLRATRRVAAKLLSHCSDKHCCLPGMAMTRHSSMCVAFLQVATWTFGCTSSVFWRRQHVCFHYVSLPRFTPRSQCKPVTCTVLQRAINDLDTMTVYNRLHARDAAPSCACIHAMRSTGVLYVSATWWQHRVCTSMLSSRHTTRCIRVDGASRSAATTSDGATCRSFPCKLAAQGKHSKLKLQQFGEKGMVQNYRAHCKHANSDLNRQQQHL